WRRSPCPGGPADSMHGPRRRRGWGRPGGRVARLAETAGRSPLDVTASHFPPPAWGEGRRGGLACLENPGNRRRAVRAGPDPCPVPRAQRRRGGAEVDRAVALVAEG